MAVLAASRHWHPWSATPPNVVWIWGAGLFVMALVLVARSAHMLMATPSESMLARRADARFALGERASTSLDVRRDGVRNVVARSLLDDAEKHADRIDPVTLVPGPGAGPVVRALLVVAVAIAAWAVPVPDTPTATSAQDRPGLPAIDLARTEENARRIAELLDEEAGDDPYLDAVGRAFQDLADRIGRGDADAVTVERELEGLLGQFAQALGDDGPDDTLGDMLSTFRPPPVPGEEAVEQRTRDLPNLPAPEPGVDVLGEQEAPDTGGGNRSTSPTTPSSPLAADALDDLREALEKRQQERASQRAELGAPSNVDPDQSFAYVEGDPETLAALAERRRLLADSAGARGDTVAGGAEESTDAPGDLAGGGTAELDEGAASPRIDPSQVEVESVALPDQVREDGATVDVQAAPETEYTEVESVDSDIDRPWWRGPQSTDPSRATPVAYREAVTRYFLPDSAVDENTP